MVEISSFFMKFDSDDEAKENLNVIKEIINNKEWVNCLTIDNNTITIGKDVSVSWESYKESLKKFCMCFIKSHNHVNFHALSEFYNDDREIHESVVYRNGYYERYLHEEDYNEGNNDKYYYFGKMDNGNLIEEELSMDSLDMDEVMCKECGEYVVKHYDYPLVYCPYCNHIEEFEVEDEELVDAKWKNYDFEIPLGVALPEVSISSGEDWISDCEEDNIFGLVPSYYQSKNQYNAALRLCRVCAGWYRFDSEEDRARQLECYREVLKAEQGEPMWYFDIWQNSFDFLAALKECHPTYKGKLLEVEQAWDLFNRLLQRSCIEKADCFDWFVDFFGDYLRFESHYKLSDTYVQNYYDNHLETILYLKPEQIDILTKSVAKVSPSSTPALARAAAGLIRMGKKDIGLSLYKKAFAMVWNDKSSVDDKKRVVDQFIERLSLGYENEQYIDEDIAVLLEKQCQEFSDKAWSSKIKMNLNRNK